MMVDFNEELKFWRDFIKTERFLNGWCSNSKTPELENYIAEIILAKTSSPNSKVLDVGSGPVSILHGLISCEKLISIDVLADYYKHILDYYKLKINNKPLAIEGEAAHTLPYKFDVIYCRNALDHTQAPFTVYKNLNYLLSEDGLIIIQCFENEGIYENWQGLHKWNISLINSNLIISNQLNDQFVIFGEKGTKENIGTSKNLDRTFVDCNKDFCDKDWITFFAKKQKLL